MFPLTDFCNNISNFSDKLSKAAKMNIGDKADEIKEGIAEKINNIIDNKKANKAEK
jgi:hypothetical protein